jgi:hypothetical protein
MHILNEGSARPAKRRRLNHINDRGDDETRALSPTSLEKPNIPLDASNGLHREAPEHNDDTGPAAATRRSGSSNGLNKAEEQPPQQFCYGMVCIDQTFSKVFHSPR